MATRRNPGPEQHARSADEFFRKATQHLVDADKILTRTDRKGKVRVKGLHPLTRPERLELVGHFVMAASYLGAANAEYNYADKPDKAELCDEYLINIERALIELAGGGPEYFMEV